MRAAHLQLTIESIVKGQVYNQNIKRNDGKSAYFIKAKN
jgi:hypothetical protein